MSDGMGFSFLPEIMSGMGVSGGVQNFGALPQSMQTLSAPSPAASTVTPWYQNPGFWSMVGQVGSAISPKDSWQSRLGAVAAQQGQAMQYGSAMNKLLGPVMANGGQPTSGLSGPSTEAPKNNLPFSNGSSVLSSSDMMGLPPELISNVMGTAVESKMLPWKMANYASDIEYKKGLIGEMSQRTEIAKQKAAEERKIETNFSAEMDAIDSGTVKNRYIRPEDARFLKSMGATNASKLIDNLINLEKESKKQLQLVHDTESNRWIVVDTDKNASKRVVDTIEGTPKTPKSESWQYGGAQAVTTDLFSEHADDFRKDWYASFGNNQKAKEDFDKTMAMLSSEKEGVPAAAMTRLMSYAKPETKAKYRAAQDRLAKSLNAGTGFTGAYRQPGEGIDPGILKNPSYVPEQNRFMLEGLTESSVPSNDLNNPLNIKLGGATKKWVDSGHATAGRAATDGGVFLKFNSSTAGLEAAKQLLFDSPIYKDLTVDEAMKKWSNNGYSGSIMPSAAKKKVSELKPSEQNELVNLMAIKENGGKAKAKTASARQAKPKSGWNGPGRYEDSTGKIVIVRSEADYKKLTGGE